jgi:hypothetical protein
MLCGLRALFVDRSEDALLAAGVVRQSVSTTLSWLRALLLIVVE